ncbi:MAG: hypothetical protein QF719_10120 [Chloroflexota bacterium]|jgi:hypothetical protein|nr:hypothetical protein [Chloroflexota bacterium]MDP6509022.1 hypothetical protein [Chloroflexota bacterium]MDP6758537.1 hypothetical protein [Chloroflexota bacterium]
MGSLFEFIYDLFHFIGPASEKKPEHTEDSLEEEYGEELDELEALADRKHGDGDQANEPGK